MSQQSLNCHNFLVFLPVTSHQQCFCHKYRVCLLVIMMDSVIFRRILAKVRLVGGGLEVSPLKFLKNKSLRSILCGILVLDTALRNSSLDPPLICHILSQNSQNVIIRHSISGEFCQRMSPRSTNMKTQFFSNCIHCLGRIR